MINVLRSLEWGCTRKVGGRGGQILLQRFISIAEINAINWLLSKPEFSKGLFAHNATDHSMQANHVVHLFFVEKSVHKRQLSMQNVQGHMGK